MGNSRPFAALLSGALLLLPLALAAHPAIALDGGVDPANLGKGDWIYFLDRATNHLGGHVPAVHDLPSLMSYYKSQGIEYVIVKAATGSTNFNAGRHVPQFDSNLVCQAHAAGIKIFGYNRSYGRNVPGEIAVATEVNNLGADGFVIDAEAEWESSRRWIGTNGPALATQLCSGIKARFPNRFLGHSPLPVISRHTSFPYKEFGFYCDAVMPQAYWQDGGLGALVNYSPIKMVALMDAEWRAWQDSLAGEWTNSIKPLIPVAQAWNITATNSVTAGQITQFFEALKGDTHPATAGGYKGCNFWVANLHTAEIWAGIGTNSIGDRPPTQ